jgi:hypothetical protein
MTKFVVDVWLDGYDTDEEHEKHCGEDFVADALNDSGASCTLVRKVVSCDLKNIFENVVKTVAHPHTTITEHDRVRAAKIFSSLDGYLNCKQFLNNELSEVEKKRLSDFDQ